MLGPRRFTHEIEIAAGLQHPHILPVHDSGGNFIAVDVVGPKRDRTLALSMPSTGSMTPKYGEPVLSKDGRALLVNYELKGNGQRSSGVVRITLADGKSRDVLHFDDPLHPHRSVIRNIAEQGGRLYFTLESPESSVWTVPITGLAK